MNDWFDGRAQIWGDIEPAHDKFYSLQQQRTVSIASPVGQAQFYLGGVFPWPGRPEEQLLLCRFANTIDISCGEPELRQLKRLRRHLDNSRFEKKHGHANPLVAREVEREIQATLTKCRRVTEEDCRRWPLLQRLTGWLLRPLAPLT